MFSELVNKLNDLAHHHQVIFALIAVVSILCLSWGIETLLETHLAGYDSYHAALIAIVGGIFFLWLTKHVILNVI